MAAPPYDPAFMNCLHPLVSHPHIIDGLHAGRNADLVKEFLGVLIPFRHTIGRRFKNLSLQFIFSTILARYTDQPGSASPE